MKKPTALFIIMMIVFAAQAQTYSDIKVSDLPKAAREYVSQNIPGTTIVRAVKIDNNGAINYGAVCEGNGRKYALVFDQEGRFIQKVDKLNSAAPKEKAPDKTSTGTTTGKTPAPVQSSSHSQMKTIPVENTAIIEENNTSDRLARKKAQRHRFFLMNSGKGMS